MQKQVKVFMGLSNIAGYFSKLKSGFDELGITSYFLDLSPDTYSYNKEKSSYYILFLKYLVIQRSKYKNKFLKILIALIYKITLLPIFVWSLFKFNVFIFGFNHTFFRLFDLPVLKFFNKKVIFVYLGSDSRPPYMSGIDLIINKSTTEQLINKSKKIKNQISFVEKYADIIINNPASGQFHEKNFINWMCIGMPTVLEASNKNNSPENKFRIIHAPTRPITKGSRRFLELVEKFKNKYEIEYIELVNKPNSKVLEELVNCNFVLDEIYSDIPLGGLSSEAASFKKISIVGGYYSNEIHNDVLNKYIPPSIYCGPDDIEQNMLELMQNSESNISLGKKLFDFISENWSSKSIANKFMMLINDDYPSEWVYDTTKNSYIYGYGISKVELKSYYKNIINKHGIESLQLEHNKRLKKTILNFINN